MSISSPHPSYSLLDDPLITIADETRVTTSATLPHVLARLGRGEPTEFAMLQAHQQHPWHAFLVQLAALVLFRAKTDTLPGNDIQWRTLLIDAAAADGGGPEAFALVVPDLSKPAFMQPPVPEKKLTVLKNVHTRPSAELDILITAKNHDVKVEAYDEVLPEHWVYALVTLQTMQGFLGAGNYMIARMNGGFASRPCIAYGPGPSVAERFARDVNRLLARREEMLAPGYDAKGSGLGLVWCAPWDGTKSLPFKALDPFFIEICRRIRLSKDGDTVIAHRGSSKVARVDGKAALGNTADPWTPVAIKDGKALTLSENGFTYERVQDLMFGEWHPGAAYSIDDQLDNYWLGQVLVRGQGKTGGYHERWIPVPGKVRSFLADRSARDRLGKRAQDWVGLAKTARLNVLKPAVLNLLQGGPDKLKFDDDGAERFLEHLNLAIDGIFFNVLFDTVSLDDEAANAVFEGKLHDLAKQELDSAIDSVPMSSSRRYRSIAFAQRSFRGAARKHFPSIYLAARREETAATEGEHRDATTTD